MSLSVRAAVERWPIAGSFVISRGSRTEAVVVVAENSDVRWTRAATDARDRHPVMIE